MSRQLLPDHIWEKIERKLPVRWRRLKRGRPALSDRQVLKGILFVVRTGIAWGDLPVELGCGCGMTCLRRLRDWQNAGVWPEVQQILAENLRNGHRIDWSRLDIESPYMPDASRRLVRSDSDPGLELVT